MAILEVNKDGATWGPINLNVSASGLLGLEAMDLKCDLMDNFSFYTIQYYNDPDFGDFFAKAYLSSNSDDPNAAIIKLEFFNEEGGLDSRLITSK